MIEFRILNKKINICYKEGHFTMISFVIHNADLTFMVIDLLAFPSTLQAGPFTILTGSERPADSLAGVLTKIGVCPAWWDWLGVEFGVAVAADGDQASDLVNQLKMKHKCLPWSSQMFWAHGCLLVWPRVWHKAGELWVSVEWIL